MIHAMSKSAVRNFHLPLPQEAYANLHREAERAGRPATALAREAIEEMVTRRRRAALHDAIATYAAAKAGTAADLDQALEAASVEALLASEKEP